MDIGIVSKPSHCKTHKRVLVGMGYNVRVLGADPTSIPDSLDLLVVRVASISHGGEKVARMWGKNNDKPTIYENGISGILRKLELSGLTPNPETAVPQEDTHLDNCTSQTEAHMFPRSIAVEESPGKEHSWYKRFNFPKFEDSVAKVWESFSHKTPSGSQEFFNFTEKSAELTSVSAEDFEVEEYSGLLLRYFEFSGDPFSSMVLFFMFASDGFCPYIRDATKFYSLMTGGKSLDTATIKGVAWHMGLPSPKNAPRGGVTSSPTPVQTSLPPVQKDGSNQEASESGLMDTVESNTSAILEVMEDLSTFKGGVGGHIASLRDEVNRLKKTIRDMIGAPPSDYDDTLNRIKKLELGESETLRQAQHGARQAAAEAIEKAKATPTTHDPLAALNSLEQVKAALKAAGFTGTLTLTID